MVLAIVANSLDRKHQEAIPAKKDALAVKTYFSY